MPTNCPEYLNRPVHLSLGAYGRMSHAEAIADALAHPPRDPVLGTLSTRHLQLCPQNQGVIDTAFASHLRATYPDIQWRLHANVRNGKTQPWADIADFPQSRLYFWQLAYLSHVLKALAYSAHAGRRSKATLAEVFRYTRELEQSFGVPVAIEGHYPTHDNFWLIDSWKEYRMLLDSGVHYALDLSHIHILATWTQSPHVSLVQELLASERCIEIHLSGNNGQADQHRPLQEIPWWLVLLADANPNAVVFSESRRPVRNAQEVAA